MTDILTIDHKELAQWLKARHYPSYAATVVYDWVFKKYATDFAVMSNIARQAREALARNFTISAVRVHERLTSKKDETRKYVFSLFDGHHIESAVIPGVCLTACLSTQVGCKFACGFCASGTHGFVRNLKAEEIVSQYLVINHDLAPVRADNIVCMGIGEPLDNMDNLLKALALLTSPEKFAVSHRRITVSTCGLPDKIAELARAAVPPELAVSLHAPTDELRNTLMPINKAYGLKKLIESCKEYTRKTKRLVTFEYMMIRGVNDSKSCALALHALVKGFDCKINIIPCNAAPASDYVCASRETIDAFRDVLHERGVKVTIRATRGEDIQAACGQLRLSSMISAAGSHGKK
jgi:23S rRNA (adenine2503-C2)-methyltransferase